jgi:aminoglycoside 6'-N-acetyltransferase
VPDEGITGLRTPRLVLRRLVADDAHRLAQYRSDPAVAVYQGWDAPYPLEAAQRFVADHDGRHPDTPGEWFQLGIAAVTEPGRLLGDVGVFVDGDDPRLARVGFTLAADAQGRGYATEAVTAVLDWLFDRGKHRVSADCDARNVRSAALLERVGMRREGHHLASAWWKGEWTDELVFAVLASEWSARHNR